MSNVRTRYAPSPTGIPHIGNIRTALYNYLFAKSQSGKFILRIEDTDKKRKIEGAVEKIKESLKILNLNWDEEVHQSQRLNVYKDHLETLKFKNLIYEEDGAWRFKVEKNLKLSWQDAVYKDITFDSNVIEDFIIMKSDGFPTYHFASVVDDHEMQITHVLRGEEWISSTPKHLLLYKAFGWSPPIFVHLPLIFGSDKKKLSKREGAKTVFEYLKEGYLPQSLVNFLALLGWSPKDEQEIFSQEELTKTFEIARINKNNPIFNIEKLKWFNGQWIRSLENKKLSSLIHQHFPKYNVEKIAQLIPIIKQRLFTLKDFEKVAGFFYQSPTKIPTIDVSNQTVKEIINNFISINKWEAENIKKSIEDASLKQKQDRIKTIMAVRNITTGQEVTPPLYESLEIIGKNETLSRLKNYVAKQN